MKQTKKKSSTLPCEKEEEEEKGCVQHETMQSSLREPNDGSASPSNLRTNKISCN